MYSYQMQGNYYISLDIRAIILITVIFMDYANSQYPDCVELLVLMVSDQGVNIPQMLNRYTIFNL